MALLGIDTGGTFTDAVLFDEASGSIVATAKAPTTYHDLSIGITGAIDAVLSTSGIAAAEIELVSLSTTLATNALVEGRGRGVALVVIGFDEAFAERAGLPEALAGAPMTFMPGGHNAHGSELAPFDEEHLRSALAAIGDRTASGVAVEAYAVVSQFSVRNPSHELAARRLIRSLTGRPVTCSHELSAQLDAPRRAVTAVLNARLIPIVDELLSTLESALAARRIEAPVMVVRGDGSLVSSAFVRDRPIETILSGPAASLVGAGHLSDVVDGLVSDIGGTTTDIARLRGGRPVISADGASVGGHRTMVEAVAMHTLGLGGDSEVHVDGRARGLAVTIGPRRVIPLGQLALAHRGEVESALRAALTEQRPGEWTGVLLIAARSFEDWQPQADHEVTLAQALAARRPVHAARITGLRRGVVRRLIGDGVIAMSAFTPTDACHILGWYDHFDSEIAQLGGEVMAHRRDAHGLPVASDATTVARVVVDAVVARSADAVFGVALTEDGLPADLVDSPLVRRAFAGSLDLIGDGIGLRLPIVALGASAATYYPAVAERLKTTAVVPPHAAVANAVGAVVGRVRISRVAAVRSPAEGMFSVHLGDAPTVHTSLDAARDEAEARLRTLVEAELSAAGASDADITSSWTEKSVDLSGLTMFVSGELTVIGTGRPDLRRPKPDH